MAVRGVDHEDVHPGRDQRVDPLVGVRAGPYRRTHPQARQVVLAGVRVVLGALDVLHRDEAAELAVAVDDEQLLDAMLVEEPDDLVAARGLPDGDELVFRGHGEAHGLAPPGLEPEVAGGHDADQPLAVHHRHPGDPAPARELGDLADCGVGTDRDRVAHHAALELLHAPHLVGLDVRRQVPVDDPDAAFLGERDGEPGLGHHVHRGGHDGDAERDPGGENGGEVGVAGEDFGVSGRKHHIVEGEGFFDVSHRHLVLLEIPAGRWAHSLS